MDHSREIAVDFCTLGMFIIDEIHPHPSSTNSTVQTDVIGGAGTYSAIGARLWSPPPMTASIGWVVDTGNDFPRTVRTSIERWQTGVTFRERDGLTTRGWNGYTSPTFRAFKYLTPKLRLTPDDLSPQQVQTRSIHLICSPSRCIAQCDSLARHRALIDPNMPQPLRIWEPVPDLCVPSELDASIDALEYIDVVSPNHEELASLFGSPENAHSPMTDRSLVESQAMELLAKVSEAGCWAIVVRCAASGAYIYAPRQDLSSWMPAYHMNASKVVDPTGAGNGFLGGLAIGLVRNNRDILEACRWGTISASFCVEQVGPPMLTSVAETVSHEQSELWNGKSVHDRLVSYKNRSQ